MIIDLAIGQACAAVSGRILDGSLVVGPDLDRALDEALREQCVDEERRLGVRSLVQLAVIASTRSAVGTIAEAYKRSGR